MRFVEIQEFVHQGGTKDYVLVLLIDQGTNECTLLKRNGSREARGQMQRGTNGSEGNVRAAASDEAIKRHKNGYSLEQKETFIHSRGFQSTFGRAKWAQPGTKIYEEISSFFEGHDEPSATAEVEPLADIDRGDEWGSW